MMDAASFVDEIHAVAGELRREPSSPVRLNRAAARIDQLGRRLHGVGWIRDHEIGRCLTLAVSELGRARGLPEPGRAGAVDEALRRLDDALAHAREGLRPDRAEPVTEHAAEVEARDER